MLVYYAYVNSETKQWYLFRTDDIKGENLILLYTIECQFTASNYYTPDPTEIAPVTGIFKTTDNCRIEILDRKWYGLNN